MITIKELIIKTTIEPRVNHQSNQDNSRIDKYQMKIEIIEEAMEHFSKVLKNKKER